MAGAHKASPGKKVAMTLATVLFVAGFVWTLSWIGTLSDGDEVRCGSQYMSEGTECVGGSAISYREMQADHQQARKTGVGGPITLAAGVGLMFAIGAHTKRARRVPDPFTR